jgi:hypothetical protein
MRDRNITRWRGEDRGTGEKNKKKKIQKMIEEIRLADPAFHCDANPDADPAPLQGDANMLPSAESAYIPSTS